MVPEQPQRADEGADHAAAALGARQPGLQPEGEAEGGQAEAGLSALRAGAQGRRPSVSVVCHFYVFSLRFVRRPWFYLC